MDDAKGSLLFKLAGIGVTEAESSYDMEAIHAIIRNNFVFFGGVVVLYLLMCFFGPKLMKSVNPFELRPVLAIWNGLLCLFSILGMVRTAPFLIGRLMTESYKDTICSNATEAYGHGAVGLWTMLFILSKVPELGDTVFLILRKRDVIFLHWYHHATVLLFCWHAYAMRVGTGLYFVAMNYSVHAIMYGYFCLQCYKLIPKWFPSYLITVLQIVQMVVGTFVCASAWYYHMQGEKCDNDIGNLIAGAVMYGSYLAFFVDFAIRKFVFPAKKQNTEKAKKTK